MLLHGSMDRSASLARTVRRLPDLRVVRYDRRGYGRSLGAGPAGLDGHVDDLFQVLDGRRAVVVGHSFGGLVALVGAAQAPDQVLAAGAFEPPTPWLAWWPVSTDGNEAARWSEDPAEAAEAFMRRVIGDDRWEGLPRWFRSQRRAEGEALVAEVRSIELVAAPFAAASMAVPVLLGRGTESSHRHARAVEELVRTLPGARVHVIDGAGHHAPFTHPAAYAEYVRMAAREGGLGSLEPR